MSARDLAVTAAMDEDTHGDLKEIQRSCAKSAESIFGMAAKRLSLSGGMGDALSARLRAELEHVDLHEVRREKERTLVSRAHNDLVLLVQQMQADAKWHYAASTMRAR